MSNKQTQAQRVINKFGGVQALCTVFKAMKIPRAPSTVYRWTYGIEDLKGTRGLIPHTAIWDVLHAAHRKKIELTSEDLDPRPL